MFTSPAHGMARGRALSSALMYVRGRQDVAASGTTVCICDRTRQNILCRSCGHTMTGRARRHCPIHPKEIHLMDFGICPSCRAPCSQLQEFGELKKRP